MAKSKTAEGPRPNRGYGDLRDLIALLEERGELMRIDGADWNLEIGTLQELIFAEMGREQGAPAMLFENIPGSPPGFRALTGTMSTTSRVATILGLPEDGGAMAGGGCGFGVSIFAVESLTLLRVTMSIADCGCLLSKIYPMVSAGKCFISSSAFVIRVIVRKLS